MKVERLLRSVRFIVLFMITCVSQLNKVEHNKISQISQSKGYNPRSQPTSPGHEGHDIYVQSYPYHIWLVVEKNPLNNMSSSVGMILPNIWENKIHVPNQQPDLSH